ncbi:MAG: hypothetical protein R3185_07445, partial [Candidatus Thermoplasmatota archaeon]|nr:hypothetical protein [Candidatus Thermoplasmatota archaeon]
MRSNHATPNRPSSSTPNRSTRLGAIGLALLMVLAVYVPAMAGAAPSPYVEDPAARIYPPSAVDSACSASVFTDISSALTCALPGATVLVMPGVYDEALTVSTSDVTICASTGGGPICATEMDTAHWQLSNSEWSEPPAAWFGEAILLDLTTAAGRSTSMFPADGAKVQDLEALSFDYYTDTGCSAGSPRLKVNVDNNADGDASDADDGIIYIYHDTVQSGACTVGAWDHLDFMDAANTDWATTAFGGSSSDTQAGAASLLNATHQIHAINLEWDGSGEHYVDNQRVNDAVLGEQQDIACNFAVEQTCRWGDAGARTIVDA